MSDAEATPTPLWSDNPAERELLGFSDIAAPALEALDREKLDPVTVGVVGWWGSGKSTILKVIERSLRERGAGVVVVETRPWAYDPATDPKATLIAEVLAALQARPSCLGSRAGGCRWRGAWSPRRAST